MGLFSLFKKPPKASTAQYRELPNYEPSQYDAPSSKQLYDTYSSQARGEGVGFTPEDLSTMKAQETDQAVRGANETYSRSMAGRRGTGGVTTGGTNRIRDRALLATSVAKSQSLRDIGIRNAVLKREETMQGIQGLDDFLQSERGEAWKKTSYKAQQTTDWNANERYGQDITNQNQMNRYLAEKEGWDTIENRAYQAAMMAAGMPSGGSGSVDYSAIMSRMSPQQQQYYMPQWTQQQFDYSKLYKQSATNYR